MCVAHDHAAIAQNADALGLADPAVRHLPLTPDRTIGRVNQDATGGVQSKHLALVAERQTPRRRLERTLRRHRPHMKILHRDRRPDRGAPAADGVQAQQQAQQRSQNDAGAARKVVR